MTDPDNAFIELEQSWADLAHFLRGGAWREKHLPNGLAVKCNGLDQIHRRLELSREAFVRGDRSVLFGALLFCVDENLPVPYWLAGALSDIGRRLVRESVSLHQLFGLEKCYPTRGKRADKARKDRALIVQLWSLTHHLRREGKGSSLEAALKQAREQLRFPYSQRKARQMFDEQETRQNAALDAMDGIRRQEPVR